jgi:hypothetical protein
MKPPGKILLLSALTLALAIPSFAQVEKASMRTKGISCGVCAVVSEVHLRRIEGVDKISISKSAESVMVSYKPSAPFHPAELRKAVEGLNVAIVQFQVNARGRVLDQNGKQFFVAGKDKFLLTPSAGAPKVPSGTPVIVEAILNDKLNPMELRVLSFKPITQ